MDWKLVFQFLLLLTIVPGVIIVVLYWLFFSGVENAKKRLEHDAESARAREAELNRKIRQADDELKQRKKELDALEQKMKGDLESEATKHKEALVNKARAEAEEIITKAQNAAEAVRRDIERVMELKIIDYSTKILDDVLTSRAKGALELDLINEFIEQLAKVDMSKVSTEIKSADLVTINGMTAADVKKVEEIISSKTGRAMTLTPKSESGHISGVILKFGSLQLDGSLKTAIRDKATALKIQVEKSYQDKK